MSKSTKATRQGSYVCRVGFYDIRHKVEMPRKVKNNRGDGNEIAGKVEAGVYHGRKLIQGGFPSHQHAIAHAKTLLW